MHAVPKLYGLGIADQLIRTVSGLLKKYDQKADERTANVEASHAEA